ncbi:hypothetical protein AMQ83_21830 [Paenibacillus riograndensis]|nr:hypothetical protein AMQ83_21830 [Paenibacillus riograndensis]
MGRIQEEQRQRIWQAALKAMEFWFLSFSKTRHRRMTGLRSWNEYIVRSGELVVFVDDALRQKDLLTRLQNVK